MPCFPVFNDFNNIASVNGESQFFSEKLVVASSVNPALLTFDESVREARQGTLGISLQ